MTADPKPLAEAANVAALVADVRTALGQAGINAYEDGMIALDRLASLASHLEELSTPPAVGEEMVERAAKAAYEAPSSHGPAKRKWEDADEGHRGHFRRMVLAALSTIYPPTSAGDWVLVPRVPTEAMIVACETALDEWRKTLDADERILRSRIQDGRMLVSAAPREKHAIRWAAMLAAAPTNAPRDSSASNNETKQKGEG